MTGFFKYRRKENIGFLEGRGYGILFNRYKKKRALKKTLLNFRAGDGAQTRDPQLGRLMLYQLSYSRNCIKKK